MTGGGTANTAFLGPNATAIYCQGRLDASAFLDDARRAEDELALFTEIAAWRPDIEARFLKETGIKLKISHFSSNEELQSINEELTTVNSELKIKFQEASRAHSDLQNLMSATEIGTLFVDRELRITAIALNRNELGYVAGVGYQAENGVSLNLRYTGAFSDFVKSENGTYFNGDLKNARHSAFQLSLGYLIPGK